ncbi:MAG: SMI1/KNR4 family protein [Pirellulales bacterium]
MTVLELVESIRREKDCEVLPVGLLPSVEGNELPPDLVEFYSVAGGAVLFREAPYEFQIASAEDFVRANPIIVGDACDEDISHDWYIIAKSGEQYITIDLGPGRVGKCYDSFWDRHGVPGSCPIIATSFRDLLERLLISHGKVLFWLEPQFENLGDAYDVND